MTDLSQTIIPKSSQLNADDLIGGPRTVTITKVSANPGNAEQPIAINYEGDEGRPYMPCKTARRVMVSVWGTDGNSYAGKSMTLYRDPEVTWGGMKVGGIRISHMSGLDRDKQLVITESKTKRKPVVIKPIADAPKPAAPASDAPTEAEIAAAVETAKNVARRGTEAFKAWWATDERKAVWPIAKVRADEIKALAAEADEINAAQTGDDDEGDPFGLPELTPDQLAEAERAARDHARSREEMPE